MRTLYSILVLASFLNSPGALALSTPERAYLEDLLGMGNLACSGALVDIGRADDGHAVLLTNGHCVRDEFLRANEIIQNTRYDRGAIHIGTSAGWQRVSPRKVIYGTMTDTDLGLIELEETYRELKRDGAKVYKISANDPQNHTKTKIVSGYWTEKQSCQIDRLVYEIREGDWTWKGSFRFDADCLVRGGYSGSPVLSEESGEIVAILNTGNENGESCTLNNPCEVSENGHTETHYQRSYAQRVSDVPACFHHDGEFDLHRDGCKLPR